MKMVFITHVTTTMNRTWTEEKELIQNPGKQTNKQIKRHKKQIVLLVLEDFISSKGMEILD